MRFSRLSVSLLTFSLLAVGVAFAQAALDPAGRPEHTKAGTVEHYAVWHDKEGWHLRTMTKEHEHHFRGNVAVKNGELEDVKGVMLEKKGPQKDNFMVGPEKKQITFDFSTKGGEDGVDWKVKGKEATLVFTLEIGEKEPQFEADRIFVGKKGEHPTANGFELPAHPPHHEKK